MMRLADPLPEILLCREPIDFRKGIPGLSVLVEAELSQDPFTHRLFVFINRSRTSLKMLYWERNGFCLWQKKLEQERFKWPRHLKDELITLDDQQLNWLLEGYDLRHLQPHKMLRYKTVL
jgi:transposase